MKNSKIPMSEKHTSSRSGKSKTLGSEYLEHFVPNVCPAWEKDEDNFSLEQPSPLKLVPTETRYSIGGVYSAPVA
jgi:hypothetical protein